MYDTYQDFYAAVEISPVFHQFCEEVYGADFSQDGFSDIREISDVLKKAKISDTSTVLDIGCGNGKMCEYIHDQTGAEVWGYDYSDAAIQYARRRTAAKKEKLRFDVGIIGDMEYPDASFDTVLSIDTIYFTSEPEQVIRQARSFLRPAGMFIVMYGAFDFSETGMESDKTKFGKAVSAVGLPFEAVDYTNSFYALMRRKHETAMKLETAFSKEGLQRFQERLLRESIDPAMSFNDFQKHFRRYMYIIQKQEARS